MRHLLLLLMVFWTCCLAGCSSGDGKELYDTAQLEEKQHNLEHAKKLYGEIAGKYPNTEAARKAEERLKALR